MNNYDIFTGTELSIAEKVQQRRYQMLIHSCIYYELNQNIISDDQWNKWAIELKELQQQYPDISKQVTLYEYFKDWNASTGAFLPITLDWVMDISHRLINIKPVQQPTKKTEKKRRLF